MKLGIMNREAIRALSPALEDELDRLMAGISTTFLQEHDWRGRHTNISALSVNTVPATQEQVADGLIVQQAIENEYNIDITKAGGVRAQAGSDIAAGGSNALLDGSKHTDTVAQTVSRGSLVYGSSTPKWDELVIGAASRVLRSDGTDPSWAQVVLTTDVSGVLPVANGGSGSSAGGVIRSATISLTESQLENLNATPVQVVAAAGADAVIIPLYFMIELVVTTGYGASPTFSLRHPGAPLITGAANPSWGTTGTKISTAFGVAINYLTSSLDPRNLKLEIIASADNVDAGVATATVIVVYNVVTGL